MDSKEIIREFNDYVDCFVECCENDKRVHELLKAVAYLIEDQEERIAIMSENGWVSVKDAMPDDYRDAWVWTRRHLVDAGCHYQDYWSLNSETTLIADKENLVTHWQYKRVPEPPKEGDPE